MQKTYLLRETALLNTGTMYLTMAKIENIMKSRCPFGAFLDTSNTLTFNTVTLPQQATKPQLFDY